jgi:hypothetical protein
MNSPSHEHLLGFVLGALEPFEHEQLQREMAKNPELATQAEVLAERLKPLDCCRMVDAPPAGLASRTCCRVFEQVAAAEKVTPARQGVAGAMQAEYNGEASRWSLSDMVVAAGIFLAAGALFFPAIANSRYQAQLAQCQNNLKLIGEAYARGKTQHPSVDYHNVLTFAGNRGVAGIQPALLAEQGLLPRDNVVICPASPQNEQRQDFQLPTLEAIDTAHGAALADLHRQSSGSLAFSLGHLLSADDADLSSDNHAVVADAPSGVVPQLVSSHHGGKGQNVLFESGRTAFICGCGDEQCGDSLFWNRNLKVEVGLDARDIVLARGGTRPFGSMVSTLLQTNE